MRIQDIRTDLATRFPEARFELRLEAEDAGEAEARSETLIATYASLLPPRAADDGAKRDEYIARLSALLGGDPDGAEVLRDRIVSGLMVGASVADVLLVSGSTHAVEATSAAIDHVTSAVDGFDALTTFGLSLLASIGIGWVFQCLNRKQQEEIGCLAARAFFTARLSDALLSPGKSAVAADTLRRLKESST